MRKNPCKAKLSHCGQFVTSSFTGSQLFHEEKCVCRSSHREEFNEMYELDAVLKQISRLHFP